MQHIANTSVLTGEQYLLEAYRAKKAPMAAWLNVYHRDFLIKNNLLFQKGILHEDEEFTPRCLLAAKTVVCTGICFYHYIIRDNSITTSKDKRKNACDLYETCLTLEKIYDSLENKQLKKSLKDSLSVKYLNIFQVGKLYQYGNEYLHKGFIIKNARSIKTRIKATLYCMSPKIYYALNQKAKRIHNNNKSKEG